MQHIVQFDLQHCEKIFDEFDENKNNKIEPEELLKMLQLLHMNFSQDDVDTVFTLFDSEGKGHLTKQEFSHFVYVMSTAKLSFIPSLLFYIADTDYSKTIDQNELVEVFTQLGCAIETAALTQLFSNKNRGDPLSYEQFCELLLELGIE